MNSRVQDGMRLLLESENYAREVESEVSQFAVALQDLLAVGLLRVDVHWLIAKGFVEHIRECHRSGHSERLFAVADTGNLTNQSCFVLTRAGFDFGKLIAGDARSFTAIGGGNGDNMLRVDSEGLRSPMPHWDAGRRTLYFGDVIVKEFLVPAESQETVLAEFERLAWQECIDNPLLDGLETSAERRLHDAISRLNRRQQHSCLRFHSNGKASGVRWEQIVLVRPCDAHGARKRTRSRQSH